MKTSTAQTQFTADTDLITFVILTQYDYMMKTVQTPLATYIYIYPHYNIGLKQKYKTRRDPYCTSLLLYSSHTEVLSIFHKSKSKDHQTASLINDPSCSL